jgi:hypothetical protein
MADVFDNPLSTDSDGKIERTVSLGGMDPTKGAGAAAGVSDADMAKVESVFQAMDADKDGLVTIMELSNKLREEEDLSDEKIMQVMRALDTDGS